MVEITNCIFFSVGVGVRGMGWRGRLVTISCLLSIAYIHQNFLNQLKTE